MTKPLPPQEPPDVPTDPREVAREISAHVSAINGLTSAAAKLGVEVRITHFEERRVGDSVTQLILHATFWQRLRVQEPRPAAEPTQ